MKHFALATFLMLACPLFLIGQDFTIASSDNHHVNIHFELGDYSIDTIHHEGELMHAITTKGIVASNEYGLPDLPTFSRFIAIPQGAKAIVEVTTACEEYFTNINMTPSMGSQCENDPERPFFKDPKVYATNAFFPSESYHVDNPQQMRGVDVIHIGLCPFQCNPATHELTVHKSMDIAVRFEGGNGHFGDDRLRSPYWDPILKNNILNHECLKQIDYDARMQEWSRTRGTGCEYLIITPDNDTYVSAANDLASFRNKQGILTKVMRVTEIENPEGLPGESMIKQWIREIYANWDIPPVAVCLIGESGENLQQFVPGCQTIHPKDGIVTSDNPYADIDDDLLPDICFSRIFAQYPSDLFILCSKPIEYEYTHPITDPHYYHQALTAGAWQNPMWFQITIATISGFLSQHGKMPIRINEIYSGELGANWSTAPGTNSIVNYFGPEGVGYIPTTPGELGGWTGGNAQQVIQAINNGVYIIQHRDHGWNTKWYQPEIYTTDFGDINNTNKMSYLISINCRTGMYDASTVCFTEELMRMTRGGQNAGIVGAIAPVGQSYSYANDIFLWGVWDMFDSSFLPDYGPFETHSDNWLPAFACVAGKYFLETQVFPSTNEEMRTTTYNTFHTFGDAFFRIFTEVPQPITTTHDESLQCFEPFHITAPEGSQIALTYQINDQWHIVATATGTGDEQTITVMENIPSNNIHLTITGVNLIRMEEDIPIVPYNTPFVVVDSIALNNGSLTLHYNQDATADINVTNIGLQGCNSGTVTMSTNSVQMAIVQGEASFEALAANESQLIDNAFQITLSDSILDRTRIPFTLTTQFGNETYAQEYEIEITSPSITARLVNVDDAAGNNNGRLDPGEFATLTFQATNTGHYRAENPIVSLTADPRHIRVITQEMAIDDLEVGASTELTFEIFAEFLSGEVPNVHFLLQFAINRLRLDQDLLCPIGFVLENFENGIIETEYWANDRIHPWTTVTAYPYEGDYCAKSGDITHNESSSLSLTFFSTQLGELSFYKRVSSEENYDFLKFYIDNVERDAWSGDLWWYKHTYSVFPGQHNYTWTYIKDHSVDSGADAAYIDYVTLPPCLDGVVEQADAHTLNLHPNPTTDQVTVELEQEGSFVLKVFNGDGKLILQKNNATTVSFRGLSAGLYLIVVEQNGQQWSRRIVKM